MISGAQSHALLEDLESSIISWLDRGDVKNLEKLVLLGFGDMMLGLIDQARHRASIKFLRQLPSYQAKIDAIHQAVERKDLQTLKELVKKNKLALARDRFGTTVLQKAVMNNDFNTVVWLLNKFPRVVDVQDNNKRTALHYAAVLSSHQGDKIYQFLLNAGANLQIKDRDGRTPKDYLQNPHLADHLVHRTDSSKQDQTLPQHFNYLLSLWLREGRVMKLAQLVFSGCGDVLLGRQSSHPASQSFLQEVSFHLEKISKIHEAVKSGDMDATQLLATAKKWAIARNRQGETPLHTAVNNDRLDILKYLLHKFPETVNAKDYQLRTPLHYSAGRGVDNECYKYLLEAGADENSKDCDGRKPKYYITHPESLRVKMSRSPSAEVHNNSDASSLDSQDSLEIMTSSGTGKGNEQTIQANRMQKSDKELVNARQEPLGGLENKRKNSAKTLLQETDRNIATSLLEYKMEFARNLPLSPSLRAALQIVGLPLMETLVNVAIQRPLHPISYIASMLKEYEQ